MNKRQARKLALDIAIAILDSEWQLSSDLTNDVIEEAGFDVHANQHKVRAELSIIIDQLIVKRQAFAD